MRRPFVMGQSGTLAGHRRTVCRTACRLFGAIHTECCRTIFRAFYLLPGDAYRVPPQSKSLHHVGLF